jgi:Transposase domain (DUF772)
LQAGPSWAEHNYWQYFCGEEYFQPCPPCDPTNLVRFRQALGEAGVEELLATTIAAAVRMKAVTPVEFERVIVDTTVQEKAIAYPTDSRLLEVTRARLVLQHEVGYQATRFRNGYEGDAGVKPVRGERALAIRSALD